MPLFRDEQSLLICGLEQSEASSPFSTWSPWWHNLVVIHNNHREYDSFCSTHTKRALLFDTILTGLVPYLYPVPHNLLQEFCTWLGSKLSQIIELPAEFGFGLGWFVLHYLLLDSTDNGRGIHVFSALDESYIKKWFMIFFLIHTVRFFFFCFMFPQVKTTSRFSLNGEISRVHRKLYGTQLFLWGKVSGRFVIKA